MISEAICVCALAASVPVQVDHTPPPDPLESVFDWHDNLSQLVDDIAAAEAAEAKAAAKAAAERAEQAQTSARSSARTPTNTSLNWDALADCESGGNWSINTGNGYYGGLQFNLSTWQSNGGSGYPHQASKAEQIRVATVLYNARGASPWPSCGWRLTS